MKKIPVRKANADGNTETKNESLHILSLILLAFVSVLLTNESRKQSRIFLMSRRFQTRTKIFKVIMNCDTSGVKPFRNLVRLPMFWMQKLAWKIPYIEISKALKIANAICQEWMASLPGQKPSNLSATLCTRKKNLSSANIPAELIFAISKLWLNQSEEISAEKFDKLIKSFIKIILINVLISWPIFEVKTVRNHFNFHRVLYSFTNCHNVVQLFMTIKIISSHIKP